VPSLAGLKDALLIEGARWWGRIFHRNVFLRRSPSPGLEPLGNNKWLAHAHAPSVCLKLSSVSSGGSWVLLRCRLLRRGTNCVARIRFDTGHGFDSSAAVELPATRRGVIEEVIYLPPNTRAIRWEPVQSRGHFEQSPLRVARITFIERLLRMWVRVITMMYLRSNQQLAEAGISLRRAAFDLTGAYRAAGRLRSFLPELPYRTWLERFDTLSEDDRAAIRGHIARLPGQPLISVLMPVFNTPEPFLRRAIDSVRTQLYADWELCIADDASTDGGVRRVLDEYAAADARIRVAYRDTNGHISAASNSALELARGEYVALLDHDDQLAEHALYRVAVEINAHPEAVLIYSDEDKIDEFGQRFEPYFKPDWNPQLFLSQNFVSHLGVYRTEVVRTAGGFRPGYEGSQDYDLALRVIEHAPVNGIRHIPSVLYHWGVLSGSTAVNVSEKPYAWEAGRRALSDYLERNGIQGNIVRVRKTAFYRVNYRLPPKCPLVSIIVPTRDAFEHLRRCLNSVLRKTRYPNYELIVVDNQTSEPRARRYLERLSGMANVRVIPYDRPFNYSAINNLAAREARGEVLCLLNNDTEVITPNWLQDMLGYLHQDRVGVVGARLLYPDGAVQHAGILLHPRNIAVHAHVGLFKRESGYFGRAIIAQDFTAVTGACLMVWKHVYEEVGGLDEQHLPIAFNDVDFCLRVRGAGYRVVWTPFAQLYHHEGFSRGKADTAVKRKRFRSEKNFMRARWKSVLEEDPFYNSSLTLDRPDFSLSAEPRLHKPWLSNHSKRGGSLS
jgi:GT2 family glycosyltransferase